MADATALWTEDTPDLTHAHFLGIGGVGMSAIAQLLLADGCSVSGSDRSDSPRLQALREQGATIFVGQEAANLEKLSAPPTVVVASTAIPTDNPELQAARGRGWPVVRRATALAAVMTNDRAICVAGTHGKTSTTSLLAVALTHAGLDPSYAIGGQLVGQTGGAHRGRGGIFVAETDESDGSMLVFSPQVAVITTIEPDHLDHFGTAAAYYDIFRQFTQRISPDGVLIAGIDDAGVRDLIAWLDNQSRPPRIVTYGYAADSDIRILAAQPAATGQDVTVRLPHDRTVKFSLRLPGRHMAANAAAVLAVADHLAADPARIAVGLETFRGVQRRFDLRGRYGDITIYDDYAHHPTEIAVTIAAARQIAAGQRVVAIFQPHLYSRTVQFAAAFAQALSAADLVVVLDVFGAREEPQPGITGAVIAQKIHGTTAHYLPDRPHAAQEIVPLLRADDIVLTLGAGDITTMPDELLAILEQQCALAEPMPPAAIIPGEE